jgi:hypothetical protein
MRTFTYVMGIFILFLAVDLVIAWQRHPEAVSTREAVKETAVDALAQILAQSMKLRLKLPQKVDDMTTLENISADQGTVIYGLRVNADNNDFVNVVNDVATNLSENGCNRPDYRKLLHYGLSVAISLYSQSGEQAEPLFVTPHGCGLDK